MTIYRTHCSRLFLLRHQLSHSTQCKTQKEYFKKWIKYLKLKKKQDGRYSSGLYKKKECHPYVWMPPVHTQHKESMLCQTKAVSICPIHLDSYICLDASLYVGMPPICLVTLHVWMAPYMFGCPPYASLYVWTPPYVWVPLFGFPCMHEHPHRFGCPHIFGCLDAPCTYTTQRKHALSG